MDSTHPGLPRASTLNHRETTPGGLPTAPLALAHFEIAGLGCRIHCVDAAPEHQERRGAERARLRYLPNEIAHFQIGAHRYALVAEAAHLSPHEQPTPEAARDGVPDAERMRRMLTNRELQIVQFICMGLLTKQVADRLRISEFTVRSYLKTIYAKLGVRSRAAMVFAYAQSFSQSVPLTANSDGLGHRLNTRTLAHAVGSPPVSSTAGTPSSSIAGPWLGAEFRGK